MKTGILAVFFTLIGQAFALCQSANDGQSLSAPNLTSIAIVDVSPSMKGARLQTAIGELTQYVERLPPTQTEPFILITFAEVAYTPIVFVDKKSALEAVGKLEVYGRGTNIAAGLRQATEVSKKVTNSQNLLLLLYSDGEDSEPSQVAAEEARLSQMFATRATRGLSNHVSLKRWGNANARLHAAFERDPNVDVTDAGELRVVPVAIHAALRLIDAKRDDTDPLLLHIRFQSALKVSKPNGETVSATASAVCNDKRASGDSKFSINEGKFGEHKIAVPISKAEAQEGSLSLSFLVSAETSTAPKDAVFLPVVPTPKLRLDVGIPMIPVTASIKATISDIKATRWDDALSGDAIVAAKLTITRVDNEQHDEPLRLIGRVRAVAPARFIKSPTFLQSERPGKQSFNIELVVPQSGSGIEKQLDALLELEVESKSRRLTVSPANAIRIPLHCAAQPKPRIVSVEFNVASTSKVAWARLPDICVFAVELVAEVDGPIPPRTSLAIRSPANVKRLTMEPSVLRTGRQKIRLTCWATLPPGPTVTDLSFGVDVANPLPDRLLLQTSSSISVSVTGPSPAQIQQAGSAGVIECSVADNCSACTVAITPLIVGLSNPEIARDVHVRIAPNALNQSVTSPLFVTKELQIPIRPHTGGFFEGEDIEVVIELVAAKPSAGLLPSKVVIRIHRRSPFVRFFTYVTTLLGPAIGCAFLVWALRRFVNIDDIVFGESESC